MQAPRLNPKNIFGNVSFIIDVLLKAIADLTNEKEFRRATLNIIIIINHSITILLN